MRRLALLLALCAAGCAASRSGGGALTGTAGSARTVAGRLTASTAADSLTLTWTPEFAYPSIRVNHVEGGTLTLRWTAPRYGTRGCDADTRDTLRDPLLCAVLRLRGQAPAWRPGCERIVACWDSVRRQTTPDTVARLWTLPGAACSVRAAQGEYVVVARNAAGVSCWSQVKGGVR